MENSCLYIRNVLQREKQAFSRCVLGQGSRIHIVRPIIFFNDISTFRKPAGYLKDESAPATCVLSYVRQSSTHQPVIIASAPSNHIILAKFMRARLGSGGSLTVLIGANVSPEVPEVV